MQVPVIWANPTSHMRWICTLCHTVATKVHLYTLTRAVLSSSFRMEAPEGFVVPRSELGWPTGNGFSPIKGDPRFSRITPDKLLARIEAASAQRCNVVGRKEMWAANLMHTKARKLPHHTRERRRIIALMEEKASAVEDAAEKPQLNLASPAPLKPVAPHETEAVFPAKRARFGGECSGLIVCATFDV